MQSQYLIRREVPQVPPYEAGPMAQGLGEALARFLFPLLVELDTLLDKRLVRTFLATIQVIITFRDRANGLLLSELGGYLETPDKAPAGTKRRSRLAALLQMDGQAHRLLPVATRQPAIGGVDASWRGGLGDLGRKRVGEAGESAARRALCRALQQSQALDPLQTGLLLATSETHLRTGPAMDRPLAGRSERPAGTSALGGYALVERARSAGFFQAR